MISYQRKNIIPLRECANVSTKRNIALLSSIICNNMPSVKFTEVLKYAEITNTFYFDIRPCHKCILLMQFECRNSLQQKLKRVQN